MASLVVTELFVELRNLGMTILSCVTVDIYHIADQSVVFCTRMIDGVINM